MYLSPFRTHGEANNVRNLASLCAIALGMFGAAVLQCLAHQDRAELVGV